MKKLLGTLLVGTVVLIPTGAMAAGSSGSTSTSTAVDPSAGITATPIFVTSDPLPQAQPAPVSQVPSDEGTKADKKAEKQATKDAKEAAKEEKRAAQELEKETKRIEHQ